MEEEKEENELTSEWVRKQTSEGANQKLATEKTRKRANELMSEWAHKQTSERADRKLATEETSEWAIGPLFYALIQSDFCYFALPVGHFTLCL